MSSPNSTPGSGLRWLTAPSFVVLLSALNLIVLAVVVSFAGPSERSVAANGVSVCSQFDTFVKDVRSQSIPVSAIQEKLDDFDLRSATVDRNLRPAVKGFVHAAREAVVSSHAYPAFDLMAYSETYEQMDDHMMAQDSIKRLSKTCASEGYATKSPEAKDNGTWLQPFLAQRQDQVASPPGDEMVKDPPRALATVQGYLATKPWGVFGATCAQWVYIHYRADLAAVVYVPADQEWVIDVPRNVDALGPRVIRYHVSASAGLTYGDKSNNLESPFAEGCDKY